MESCIFCSIIEGTIPSHKIYEDENFLAFLDIRPRSPGHTLVVPKKHYRWAWDLPMDNNARGNAGDYFLVAQKIALAQKKAFGIDLVMSKIIGEEVPHAHIWIFPDSSTLGDKNDFVGNAQKIREYLQ